MIEELWIGLVGIRAKQNSEILAKGKQGYTNLILFAFGEDDFLIKAVEFFSQYGIEIFENEDTETLENRRKSFSLDQSLLEAAERAAESGEPQFGKIHTFEEEK